MRRLLLLLTVWPLTMWGQIFNPVSWSYEYQWVDDETVELQFVAEIDEGWHLYANKAEDSEGPIPTTFYFSESEDYTLSGEVYESEYISKEDPMFDMVVVNYHEKKATFYQKIRPANGTPLKVSGEFEFMVCDDERCLPPEFLEFTFHIEDKTSRVETENKAAPENVAATEEEVYQPASEVGQIFTPVSWTFQAEKAGEDAYILNATASIDEGWHVYGLELPSDDGPFPTYFEITENPDVEVLSAFTEPKPIKAYDPNFMMDLLYHEESVTFTAKVRVKSGINQVKGWLEYMVCNAERCLPPEQVDFAFALDGTVSGTDLKGTAVNTGATDETDRLMIGGLNLDEPKAQCNIAGEITQSKKSMWMIFVLGILGGFLALLTPCVFPMIPLTVSFFTKGGKDKSGKWQSILYGTFILLIYLILSTPFHFLDSVNPEILNTISTNVYLNMSFFVIFIVFAISFFGYFEITMPSSFTNKVDSASNVGGLIGTFFMALTLALVSFSCTGPILGSLLAGSLSADGGAMQLSAGMAGFGLALALPFALFAAFPGWLKKMPKSGGWLNTVKVVLGFLELALAIKFLSNADLVEHWGILPRELFFGLWIVIGLGLVLYLLGILRFPHDPPKPKISWGRRALAGAVAAFVIYLVPGLSDGPEANRKLLSGFPPPLFYSVYEKDSNCPLGIECFKDYEAGMAYARTHNKPVLLDFTGWACVNCRKMEENVWPEEKVFEKLNSDFVLISLYVDDRKKLPEEEQFEYVNSLGQKKKIRTVGNKWSTFQTVNFQNNSQPFYAIIGPDGALLNNPVGYTPDADEYARFLECGLSAFSGNAMTTVGQLK